MLLANFRIIKFLLEEGNQSASNCKMVKKI